MRCHTLCIESTGRCKLHIPLLKRTRCNRQLELLSTCACAYANVATSHLACYCRAVRPVPGSMIDTHYLLRPAEFDRPHPPAARTALGNSGWQAVVQ
eukprot:4499312-Pleurochrysis_carterae.AAC.2